MDNIIFRGFSTNAPQSSNREWALTDIDLIKRDLINHFYTNIGERVMRPTYGTRLWEYIMEPNVEQVRNEIIAEVERVISLDTRLSVRNINISEQENAVIVAMEMTYRPFDITEVFQLEFDRRQGGSL